VSTGERRKGAGRGADVGSRALPQSPDVRRFESTATGAASPELAAAAATSAPKLSGGGVVLSPVCWIADATMDRRRWIECGRRLGRAGNSSGWWIGDWLRFGSLRYGEKYVLASRVTGYDRQTLMNFAYVASRIQPHERRVDVSWSHHAELANLDERARSGWLERIVSDRLSVRDLRRELRSSDRRPPPAAPTEASGALARCPTCGQSLRSAAPSAATATRPPIGTGAVLAAPATSMRARPGQAPAPRPCP
jgi:hypothetical protein